MALDIKLPGDHQFFIIGESVPVCVGPYFLVADGTQRCFGYLGIIPETGSLRKQFFLFYL